MAAHLVDTPGGDVVNIAELCTWRESRAGVDDPNAVFTGVGVIQHTTGIGGVFAVLCGLVLAGGCTLGHEQAHLHLADGDIALANKDIQAAVAEFQEAVRLDPSYAEAHTKLGLAHKQQGNLTKAAEALKAAVRLDPNDFVPIFELGEVYRLLNKLAQAIRAYVMACELNPLDFEARVRLADCYYRSSELESAAQAYQEALKLDRRNAQAWSNLGAVYHMQVKPYQAIQAYKHALEYGTRQPAVLVNLATVYIHQHRWNTARNTLLIAIDLDPTLSPAHERLAYCLWRQESYDEAAERYQRAIRLDGKNAAAFAGYGAVRMTQYLNEPEKLALRDEAIESWHTSLELDPSQDKLRVLVEKYAPKQQQPIFSFER